MLLLQQSYAKCRRSCIGLQRVWRRFSLRKARRLGRQNAAVWKIQGLVRGFTVRQKLQRCTASATLIQRMYRGLLVRAHIEKASNAVLVLQHFMRHVFVI